MKILHYEHITLLQIHLYLINEKKISNTRRNWGPQILYVTIIMFVLNNQQRNYETSRSYKIIFQVQNRPHLLMTPLRIKVVVNTVFLSMKS
jgi:hypothetical protein